MRPREFKYPSTPESVGLMLDEMSAVLNAANVDPGLVRRMLLAVSEAFTNAMVHGNRLKSQELIKIRLAVTETDVVADILDSGKGGLHRIQSKKPANSESEGGRGIDLIRHFASSTRFSEGSNGGLRVTLTFLREKYNTISNK